MFIISSAINYIWFGTTNLPRSVMERDFLTCDGVVRFCTVLKNSTFAEVRVSYRS
jgi:hypothetical protein